MTMAMTTRAIALQARCLLPPRRQLAASTTLSGVEASRPGRAVSSSSPEDCKIAAVLPPMPHQRFFGRPCATTTLGPVRYISNSGARGSTSTLESVDRSCDKAFKIVENGTERYLVAASDLQAGQVVFDSTGGTVSSEMSRHSIQVGDGQHMTVENEMDLMDHSCSPNCFVEVCGGSHGYVASLRVSVREYPIPQGEMITLDYNAMEVDMSHPFNCKCGSANCRGRISGFSKLPLSAQQEYVVGHPEGSPPMTKVVRAWVQANSGERG